MANRLRPLIGIGVSLLLVYLVLFSPHLMQVFRGELSLLEGLFGDPRISVADMQAAGDRIQHGYAALGVAALIASLFLRAYRWRIMLAQLGPVDYWTVFHGVNLGYLLNNVLPLRAGEVLRGVIVARRSSLSVPAALSTVAAERVFDLAGLGIVFGLVTTLYDFPNWLQTAGLTFTVVLVIALVVALVVAHSRERLQRWQVALESRGKLVQRAGEVVLRLVEGLSVLRSAGAMVNVAWSTMALWVIYIGTMKLVLDAFQFTDGSFPELATAVAWLPAAILTIITALGFSIPSAPGGVGTYHGAVLLGLSWFAVPEGLAVIFATVLHGMNYLTVTVAGVISLFAMRLRFRDLVRTARSGSTD